MPIPSHSFTLRWRATPTLNTPSRCTVLAPTAAHPRSSASPANASTRKPRSPSLKERSRRRRTWMMSQRRTHAPTARNSIARSPATSNRTSARGTRSIWTTDSSQSAACSKWLSSHTTNLQWTWSGMQRRRIRGAINGTQGWRIMGSMTRTGGQPLHKKTDLTITI